MSQFEFLDTLGEIIAKREAENNPKSYSVKLLKNAPTMPARKLVEEALEVCIESLGFDNSEQSYTKLAEESADLLYHLLILWKAHNLEPNAVMAILKQRHNLTKR